MTKKRLQKVMATVYQKYGQEKTAEIADDLKDLGFDYATISGLSMGMSDFSELKATRRISWSKGEADTARIQRAI